MSEPDFYVGETWTFRGTARDVDGQRYPLDQATIEVMFSMSSGAILEFDETDPDDMISIVPLSVESPAYDWQIAVPPSRQTGFSRRRGRYRLQVRTTLPDGRVSIEADRVVKIQQSSFSRWP